MAYIPTDLKAIGAGSGKAPGFFMYDSVDTLPEIGADNYFIDAFGAFEAEDIMVVNYAKGVSNSVTLMICSTYDRQADGSHTIAFSGHDTFVGDVRAIDPIGYQSDNFSKIVDGGAPDVLFTPYTYRNNTDVLATIVADDYFIEAGLFLEIGDFVYVIANDDFALLRVATAGVNGVTFTNVVLP